MEAWKTFREISDERKRSLASLGDSWLWDQDAPTRIELPRLGAVLKEYRAAHGLTQAELAAVLKVDQSYISKIERGRRHVRDVGFLLQVAGLLGVPPGQLGLSNELVLSLNERCQVQPGTGGHSPSINDSSDPVQASQNGWRAVRRHLNQHRSDLARVATCFYDPKIRMGGTPLVAPSTWLPSEPVCLDDIELRWVADRQPMTITGTEPETQGVRPLRGPGLQYDRYTSAVRYLDPPALFENRPSYRLLDLSWTRGKGLMSFGLATYFDKLDVSEAVGHELAAFRLHQPKSAPRWRELPFRAVIGDPFDLRRRAVIPAITTLTLRRQPTHGTASFLLHWRDPGKVATAAGLYDVIPAGEFQPASVAPWDQRNDFDLWRNIVREYSEELLGSPEHDGSRSTTIDYDAWPLFRSLTRARAEGKLSHFCLGVGLDALTLAATIMTVVVLDEDVFDEAFGQAVRVNAEGIIIFGQHGKNQGRGIPFTHANVTRLLESEPLASPGAGCLALAWRHRIALMTA